MNKNKKFEIHQFLEDMGLHILKNARKRFDCDEDVADCLIGIVGVMHATVLGMCHPEDRVKLIKHLINSTCKDLGQIHLIMQDNVEFSIERI